MIHSSLIVAFAALLTIVHGHYTFIRLAVNGKWHAPLQYVRNHTDGYWEDKTPGGYSNRAREYTWWVVPSDRPESMRCGRDNMAWANKTEVLNVRAGDQIEFAHLEANPYQWTDVNFNCADGRGTCNDPTIFPFYTSYPYFHPGPVVVHISKVPDGKEVQSYDGSGEHTLGLTAPNGKSQHFGWLPRNDTNGYGAEAVSGRIIFTLPKETPKGQYLLRAASVWHAQQYTYQGVTERREGQLYHSCAQINVDSDIIGSLPKGMTVSDLMGENMKVDDGYEYPGGQLWDGKEFHEDKPKL
ncbi:hypothetical protein B0J11DRAFT_506313 [Dendryphion nanum]|uniref:lytic cellulose monooxygenase (C4-dehydrogenating) n=1 Tax=Dendryphion nanum TaxID=256645 RepID=A0A9P9INF0_9PLEO|nr:hypothetical protein B0J11DRAFT_506313 [Dendryphion nanum]